jgi:hypothetical protein
MSRCIVAGFADLKSLYAADINELIRVNARQLFGGTHEDPAASTNKLKTQDYVRMLYALTACPAQSRNQRINS